MQKTIDLRKKEVAQQVVSEEPNLDLPSSGNAGKLEIISWSGPLYYHDPDMKAVVIVSGIFLLAAVFFQIFQRSIITAILMVLIGVMIFVHAKKKPNNIGEVVVNPIGINLGPQIYKYNEIKSFWIAYQPEYNVRELSLQLKKWYMPYTKIPIEDQDPVRLRSFLIQFIPEVEHQETLSEILARRLGF